jgi:hypothetical protein
MQRLTDRWLALAILTAASLILQACGGGSSGQSNPPLPRSFTISVTPATPSVVPGNSSPFRVSVNPQNGFNGAVSVILSGLPSGLSAVPSSFSLQNAPQTVTLSAVSSMANGNYSFSLSGTSGSLNSSMTLSVGVGPLQTFRILEPTVLEVVTRFGSGVSTPLQTEVCCSPGPSDYMINFSVQGLPNGVSAKFSPNPIAAGNSTTLTLTAPANAQWIQNLPIGVVAVPTASVPPQSLGLDLVVAPPPGSIPNNRSGYLRTDDSPQSIVYDAAHQLIFSSDLYLNRVDVVSTSTRQIVRSVPVLSPIGLALTLDGERVLVGGFGQQITAISTTSLQIVQQWKLPRLSGAAFSARQLYPLSNGNVAVLVFGQAWQLTVWNPANNTISPVQGPVALPCFAAGSADGSKVILSDCVPSPGTAALYDAATNTFGPSVRLSGFVLKVAAGPDGSRFVILDDASGAALYDNQLQLVAPLAPPADITGFIFSEDAKRLYLVGGFGVPVIATFDGTTGAFISTAPAIGSIPPGTILSPSPFVETPFAVDSKGIIFGAADHGIAFDDSIYSINYILGFNQTPPFAQTVTPDFGAIKSATAVTLGTGSGFSFLPDAWLGSVRGTQASLDLAGTLTFTAPASSQPGPVSVKVIQPDGTPIFDPLAFSYGPSLMFVNGDTATPMGGSMVHLVGLGLPTDPTQIQVKVGGKSARVLSATTVKFQWFTFPYSYPYPAVDVQLTLPPGSGDADIQLTTPAGYATLPQAIHYVQNVTDYRSTDKFQAIVLDRARNQLYLSAGDHIDVFSLATKRFLSPMFPPALNGHKAFHGLAMTPDSTELIVTNFPDGSVALINPDQPSSAKAVQIVPAGSDSGPENVVATNTGKAFIERLTGKEQGCGGDLYELDLSTLQVATISDINNFCIQPEGFPLVASADGSRVVLRTAHISAMQTAMYDVASSTWSTNDAGYAGGHDGIGASSNGSVFAIGDGIMDANANTSGALAYQEVFEYGLDNALPLEKIPDGASLVYILHGNLVDIFDVNHGARLRRISLSEQVQQVTDALAIDSYGQNIYLVTNAGLTAVQLGMAPLSVGSVTPPAGPPGTAVTIYGSGFQQATAVSVNGSVLTSTFVDPNTLKAVMPSTPPGAVQIVVSDPVGHSYSLDNAFTTQ